MPEGIKSIVDKLLGLPEDQLTMILQTIAQSLGINIAEEVAEKQEELAEAETPADAEPKVEESKKGTPKLTGEREVNPEELIAKIAF